MYVCMDQCHGNVIYLGSLSTFLMDHPRVSLLLKIPCARFTWCFFQMFDKICAILSVVKKIFASRNNFGFADIAACHLFYGVPSVKYLNTAKRMWKSCRVATVPLKCRPAGQITGHKLWDGHRKSILQVAAS